MAVADGVGGNNGGAAASHYVANRICGMKECAMEFLESVNRDLISFSKNGVRLGNMATTLSGVFFSEGKAVSFHVGNSRVYSLLGGRYLKQLTEDDTTVNYLIKTGKLLPEDIESFQDKNEITACFGGGDPALLKIKTSEISDVKTFLLITDGVHNYVSIDELEDIVGNEHHLFPVCRSIAAKAEENGSTDDISVVLVSV